MYASTARNGSNGTSNGSGTHDERIEFDLRSDTVTRPTPEMRQAMANAVVGDDVYGEDPTVIELQNSCAELFGKEAALFVPSGTMANLLAILVHCDKRGSEVIVGDQSHVFLYEQAGSAQFAGVQLSLIPNKPDGTFCLKQFAQRIRWDDIHEPITQLSIVENTQNICGGKVLPLAWLDEWSAICRAAGIRTHMDGARVFNAAEHLRVPVSRVVRDVDSVCFCLSKGLSAPVGSILVGSREFIKKAHRYRKALGGGMRQVGVLAAAGIVALRQIVPLLADDHRRTLHIGQAIAATGSKRVRCDVSGIQSNILMIDVADNLKTSVFTERLRTILPGEIEAGVRDSRGRGVAVLLSARDWSFVRLVIHHEIDDDALALIVKKLEYCIAEWDQEVL